MKNNHDIPQPFRGHLAKMLSEAARMKLHAQIIESEAIRLARTLAIDAGNELPQTISVSADGSQITWETPDPPPTQTKENPDA